MKKFKLTILIGKKIIYQTILSFTEEQKAAYLQKILSEGRDEIDGELQNVVERSIGRKKHDKEFQKWEDMPIEEYFKNHPDMLICAAIQQSIYGNLFSGFSGFEVETIDGVSKETQVSELENYHWNCVPVK